jgi:hypothetical protein
MMRFTLTLIPIAQGDLADAWLNASDRTAVTEASDRIERELRTRADVAGEAVGSFRRLVDPPLEVLYKILPDGCSVWIYRIELVE